ncbi:MAG: hypothetical protein H8E72_07125 [Candidatus Marinimicrobia bacterium]|nr:hypothetical protein [Candidatus Neomarinimicrobiota bacterium]
MRNLKIILLILLFANACVEHKYHIVVSPDGSYSFEYKGHGDRQDLTDADVPLPSGLGWLVHSTLTEDVESYDYSALKILNTNELLPSTFYVGDSLYLPSLLSHPIQVQYANWFMKETYTLDAKFESRQVSEKYPKVQSMIEDAENPQWGWAAQVFNYLFTETLGRTPLPFNKQGMVAIELNRWLNEDIATLPDSVLIDDFDELKETGLDIMMQPVAPHYYDAMDSLFKQLEDQVRITLDLMDDEFEFSIILPGELVSTNADTTKGDTLLWMYSVKDFLNEDFVLLAKSEQSHPRRIKVVILLLAALLLGVSIWRRNR